MRRYTIGFVACCLLAAACYFFAGGSRHALAWWSAGIALDVIALLIALRIVIRRPRPPPA